MDLNVQQPPSADLNRYDLLYDKHVLFSYD